MMAERHRVPVQTYEQALFWLLQHAEPETWLWDPTAEFPVVAAFVGDTFWKNQNTLIRDLKREFNALNGMPRSRRGWFREGVSA
ncbi:hypothetical protein [Pararhodobacter sp.]|uniref:hypothetical protein n=1 Tax=Pararhodobacter sp. TaxID=2127056 RepID=UPI002FE0E0D3